MDKPIIVELGDIQPFGREFSSMGEDYILARITTADFTPSDIVTPWSFDGITFILVLNASGKITVNSETFDVPSNSIVVIDESTPVKFHRDNSVDMEVYLLLLSQSFLQSVSFDTNAIGNQQFTPSDSPVASLTPDYVELIKRYLRLLDDNAKMTDCSFRSCIARNLIANIFYLLIDLRQRSVQDDPTIKAPRSRRINYASDFMKLVKQHHREQRSVSFYADRLFITPKYLSLVIKETTGRSAAQWIARYVVMDAKNMLRYSGKNIQQVAYELNFPNQSSFGKYFKHCTGMSPSEFQRS